MTYEDDPKHDVNSLLIEMLQRTISSASIITAFKALDDIGRTLVLIELHRIASEEPQEEDNHDPQE